MNKIIALVALVAATYTYIRRCRQYLDNLEEYEADIEGLNEVFEAEEFVKDFEVQLERARKYTYMPWRW
jgi:hypothetical protein